MIKVAINGFGRIGRQVFKELMARKNLGVVAINDLANTATLAHLLKYDSVHGLYNQTIVAEADSITVDGKAVPVYAEKDISGLPWHKHDVDFVIESTGRHNNVDAAGLHLKAGAKRVLISAPASGSLKSVVLGVNENILNATDKIISNASCTTNNAAPMLKILDDNWGVEYAYITTVHSFTSDQNLHDAPHKDLRRARAATQSIIPTTTGAAKAITDIFPFLKGRIGGAGIRVPVPDGSLTDITCILKGSVTVELINQAFKRAAENEMKSILEYTSDPIVSRDIIGNKNSCIFDSQLTSVLGSMVKVVGWYDNEMGYATRLADLVELVASLK